LNPKIKSIFAAIMPVKNKKPTILITNDDGITANGIKALIAAAKPYGHIVVVAPDAPQSAMSNAITIGKPLRITKVDIYEGVEAYQCSGTPVDCVKLAIDVILKTKPTICLSGINHGSNASINVIYSGTMSAAMEASMNGIPSVGFSLLNYDANADFTGAQTIVEKVLLKMLDTKLAANTLFNVNIPDVPLKKLKGIKLCRQANANWKENFVERIDPIGKKYYWLTGSFINIDKATDTDLHALKNNYASLVPVHYDLTDYKMSKQIATLFKDTFTK
jgi:5'-nucleotidase